MELSYPTEGQPLPAQYWRSVTLGLGTGVLDEGGRPYELTGKDNATNQVTIRRPTTKSYAHAIVRGFYHRITADVVLDIPAVTKATTFYIALQLAPLRATSGDLPVKLDVFTSLDRTDDKDYLVLHTIRRQPNQLLTDAVFTTYRTKVAPSIMVDTPDLLPDPESVLWGTQAHVFETGQDFRAGGTGSSPTWVELDSEPQWINVSYASGRAAGGGGTRLQVKREGNRRVLRGRGVRSNGDNFYPAGAGSPWVMGTLAEADRPSATAGGIGQVDSFTNPGFARVEVNVNGEIRFSPNKDTAWVGFDTIFWYVD